MLLHWNSFNARKFKQGTQFSVATHRRSLQFFSFKEGDCNTGYPPKNACLSTCSLVCLKQQTYQMTQQYWTQHQAPQAEHFHQWLYQDLELQEDPKTELYIVTLLLMFSATETRCLTIEGVHEIKFSATFGKFWGSQDWNNYLQFSQLLWFYLLSKRK